MIQPERIQLLNNRSVNPAGRYAVYWMQASQRAVCNHALEYAIRRANELNLPLIVYFGLTPDFPEANLRSYSFMLEGLAEVKAQLRSRGIGFVLRLNSPPDGALELAQEAVLLIVDRGYLKIQREWRRTVAEKAVCQMVQVETDVVVPVETVSNKEEYMARTLRPKINRLRSQFMTMPQEVRPVVDSTGYSELGVNFSKPEDVLPKLKIDHSVGPVPDFKGGYSRAFGQLKAFIDSGLEIYDRRNDCNLKASSRLSPYLHFGQISPVEIASKVHASGQASVEDFLEELIVRRELAINFVFYNKDYDNINALPNWARDTLETHCKYPRKYIYSPEQLETAETHDPAWNAAQNEMTRTGYMSGYMRMYWGKKILEWSETPEAAWRTCLHLNNKYELDGRDPNGFTGVAWCFGKHDRAWPEHDIFGKVRTMTFNGLSKKFDLDYYIQSHN